ncbi:MAG: hypothetical protein GX081_05475 [Firmicutes bacterium]|nr:hypothetical protein [Bacillota bacterium]
MKSAVFFYLLVLLWGGGLVYQFVKLSRQRGKAWAAACVYRLLLNNFFWPVGPEARYDKDVLSMALLVKAGAPFGFALMVRFFSLTHWTEGVLVLVILAAAVLAVYYLASFRNENQAIQCVYPLSEEYGVYEIILGTSGAVREWVGTTLAELDLRRKELLVLSIAREGKLVTFPKGPEVLLAGDRLLVFGKTAILPEEPLLGKD